MIGAFLFAAFNSLVNDEIKGWLQMVPTAILRLAASQLPEPEQRKTNYEEFWVPELQYILREAEGPPLTRLFRGTTFSIGLLIPARRISYCLDPLSPEEPSANLVQAATNAEFALEANAAVFDLENSQFSTFAAEQNELQDTLRSIAEIKERQLRQISTEQRYQQMLWNGDDDDDGLAGALFPVR